MNPSIDIEKDSPSHLDRPVNGTKSFIFNSNCFPVMIKTTLTIASLGILALINQNVSRFLAAASTPHTQTHFPLSSRGAICESSMINKSHGLYMKICLVSTEDGDHVKRLVFFLDGVELRTYLKANANLFITRFQECVPPHLPSTCPLIKNHLTDDDSCPLFANLPEDTRMCFSDKTPFTLRFGSFFLYPDEINHIATIFRRLA